MPAEATTWAISPPIVPAPTTAALKTNMAAEAIGAGEDHPLNQPIGGCPAARGARTLQSVTVELLSRHLVRTIDSIGLPSQLHPVEGRASRDDAYTIHVTTSLAETAERLTDLIAGARVAI